MNKATPEESSVQVTPISGGRRSEWPSPDGSIYRIDLSDGEPGKTSRTLKIALVTPSGMETPIYDGSWGAAIAKHSRCASQDFREELHAATLAASVARAFADEKLTETEHAAIKSELLELFGASMEGVRHCTAYKEAPLWPVGEQGAKEGRGRS